MNLARTPTARTEHPSILHVDMDAFFASVEIRDDPSLRGRPVVVGGSGPRSVVAAASYVARQYGIRSAMPMATARHRAADLVIVEPRMEHYRSVSAQVMSIFSDITPWVEPISVDEAFLDVAGARRLLGDATTIGQLIRSRVREELNLPCSVGGSVSRAVAKIASAHAKPDGLLIVEAENTKAFLAPLPIGVISGVGPKAQAALARLGIVTVGDLHGVPLTTLHRAVGPMAGMIMSIAEGTDRTALGRRTKDKSLGTEHTWGEDLTDPGEVRQAITAMADTVGRSLRAKNLLARSVSLKLRTPQGATLTRSSTFTQPTSSSERLREHVVAMWEKEAPSMPRIRLAGVRAEHVIPAHAVAQELAGHTTGWQDLERAVDRAVSKYGVGTLGRGSALRREPRGLRDRAKDLPEHPRPAPPERKNFH